MTSAFEIIGKQSRPATRSLSELLDDWLDAATVLERRTQPGERVATGLPTLDRALRGGIYGPSVLSITAPPGTGKTALWEQVGLKLSDAGYVVIGIFSDEGREAACIRLGQMLGLSRDKLEAADPSTITVLRQELERRRFFFPDPDLDTSTIEKIGDKAKTLFPGERLCFIFDSIQVMRCAAADDEDNPRLRVAASMKAARKLALSLLAVVLVVSEAGRAMYASQDPEKRGNPLAAGAETREIEYKSEVQIHLEGDPDEGPVKARITKNRIGGKKAKFQLKFDPEVAYFTELDTAIADEEAKAARAKFIDAKLDELQKEIVTLLEAGGSTVNLLRQRLNRRKTDVSDALDVLEQQELVTHKGGSNRSKFYTLTKAE